jgi:hypothetical protein
MQYPITGDTNHYKGYGKKHFWGYVKGAYGMDDSEHYVPFIKDRYYTSVKHMYFVMKHRNNREDRLIEGCEGAKSL